MLTSVKQKSVKHNRDKQEKFLSLKMNRQALLNISPDDIPDIAPKNAISEWKSGDENPYFKIQAIKYPIKANRYNYHESFFESFLEGLKDAPYPGSKFGHETRWGVRDKTHFVMIGGKMEKKGNGKGIVYFKNYIPPETEHGSNETFIKELKSNMIHFSLVAYTEDEIIENSDGSYEINVIKYIKGGRNDAVPRNEGAMDQKTNNAKENSGDSAGANNTRGSYMANKEELLAMIGEFKANKITLNDIAVVMGEQGNILTDEHRKALAVVEELKQLNCDDPVGEIKRLRAEAEQIETFKVNSMLDKEFGIDTKEQPNLLRQYVEKIWNGIEGDEKKKIEAIKADPIAQKFLAERADYTKQQLGVVEPSKEKKNEEKPQPVDGISHITL